MAAEICPIQIASPKIKLIHQIGTFDRRVEFENKWEISSFRLNAAFNFDECIARADRVTLTLDCMKVTFIIATITAYAPADAMARYDMLILIKEAFMFCGWN